MGNIIVRRGEGAWGGWLSGGRGLVIGGIADPHLPPLARPLLTWGGGGQHFIFMKTYKLDNTTSPATPATALQYISQCEMGRGVQCSSTMQCSVMKCNFVEEPGSTMR